MGGALVNLVERSRVGERRKAAAELGTTLAHSLETELGRALLPAQVLAPVLRQTGKIESLEQVAPESSASPVEALLIAPKGVVARIHPAAAGGVDSLGQDVFRDPTLAAAAAAAMESRRPTLAGPFMARQRGALVKALLPLFVPGPQGGDDFWGFVITSIRMRELVRASRPQRLLERGYQYHLSGAVSQSSRPTVLARSTELDLDQPVRIPIQVPGGAWTLEVAPQAGWRSPALLGTEIVLAFVGALLVAVSTHRLRKEPEELRRQVEARSRRLSDANRELKDQFEQRERVEQKLLHDASHDSLTALSNRASFADSVQRALERSRGKAEAAFAVLFLDLDRFKYVNAAFGQAVGDQLLVALARRLEGCVRPGDLVARVGGDEFAMLLWDLQDVSGAAVVAERLLGALKLPFTLGADEVFVTASIGIAASKPEYEQAEELLRDADAATHRAKSQGRECYVLFDEPMRSRAVSRVKLEADLRRAIEREEFEVAYQPIVSLASGRIIGSEALVRWRHPARGLVSPAEFMPLAEETGMIIWIDRWVLREALRRARAWQMRFPMEPPLSASVNLSGRQLAQPRLVEYVAETLAEIGIEPRSVKLEITESVIMENSEASLEVLRRLRELGVQLLIDDFGTGYSSLSYLQDFPFHTVKIDQSFVRGMHVRPKSAEIVRTILTLAQKLGMDVIAEGVETQHQLGELKAAGCGYAQGYLFSKPVDPAALERLLGSGAPSWESPSVPPTTASPS